jgi:hypothetical protein
MTPTVTTYQCRMSSAIHPGKAPCACACRLERREDARPTSEDDDLPPMINAVPVDPPDPRAQRLAAARPGAGELPLCS